MRRKWQRCENGFVQPGHAFDQSKFEFVKTGIGEPSGARREASCPCGIWCSLSMPVISAGRQGESCLWVLQEGHMDQRSFTFHCSSGHQQHVTLPRGLSLAPSTESLWPR